MPRIVLAAPKYQKKLDLSRRSRAFMLTINNPEQEDYLALELENGKHRYCCFQLEEGEEKKTRHLQVFLYYQNARIGKGLKKIWPTAHIENVENVEAAMKYCKKEETRVQGPFEFGDPPEQGKRTDLTDLADAIRQKKNLEELSILFPVLFIKYPRGIQFLLDQQYPGRTAAPTVIWLYGLSRTGKTHYVRSRHPLEQIYVKDGTQWWDKYTQQQVILIDDFDGRWPYRDLLRLLDYMPYQGQAKGCYVKINSPYIYITCEYPPEHFWGDYPNELAQVENRLDKIIHKTKVYDENSRKKVVRIEEE